MAEGLFKPAGEGAELEEGMGILLERVEREVRDEEWVGVDIGVGKERGGD